MSNKKFRISVGDDPDHEDLTAEIYYDETYLAMLSQEAGFENLCLEIFSRPDGEAWSFGLKEFLEAVEYAQQRLWELRKVR